MPTPNDPTPTIDIAFSGQVDVRKTPPGILKAAVRDVDRTVDPFVNAAVVQVEASFDLSAARRSAGVHAVASPEAGQLIALEAEDGTTLFVRADKLAEDLRRLYPEAVKEGEIDLEVLAGRQAASRGLGEWVWSRLSILTLGRDTIIERAEEKARKWLDDWLKEKIEDTVGEAGVLSASWLGAKALMWAIESQLAGEPGLYRWRGDELRLADRMAEGDAGLADAAQKGMLVFIHGTGSHTLGAFKDLGRSGPVADWDALEARFDGRIFGFEHRTFSESPIDNALLLAETLPPQATVSLVTHSRGGLVGDLLCLGDLSDEQIRAYRREPPPGKKETAWDQRIRERAAAEEQEKLRRLVATLRQKDFRIDRYVRVAAPAGGTRLLSDNLDLFLSGLLSLTNTLVGAVAGPGASPVLSAFKRIVLEIAQRRLDARVVPGIEAMLTDSPMTALLARSSPKPGVSMGIIAGDIEGGGLFQRLGVLFTDWMFFDRTDNDLVVDTASMYAGLAVHPGAQAIFDQGEKVNHFSYFQNRRTRQGLQAWLAAAPAELPHLETWMPVGAAAGSGRRAMASRDAEASAARGEPAIDSRPVVILLPGIMGSHLEVRSSGFPGSGNRVWFDPLDIARGGFDKIRLGEAAVRPECLFDMFYGDLADYLEDSHRVVRFAYDWRLSVQTAGASLAALVEETLARHATQPLRLLAHSMGGLVVRSMIAGHPDLWSRIIERPGSRFVMLGTPNNGSHLMVETLLGKSDTIRKLAAVDLRHRMQGLLDIVAGFPGAVQLLPRPGFQDAGGAQADDYYAQAPWEDFRQVNRDRWFGDGICGLPTGDVRATARALWAGGITERKSDGNGWRHRPIQGADRLAYVFGQSTNTPCGVRVEGDRLMMVGTTEGDGSVTWASGRLDFLAESRCWHMPVDHGSLTTTARFFPAIRELLDAGETSTLGRLPVLRGAAATRSYDAGPVAYPTPEELQCSLMGTRPSRQRPLSTLRTLRVCVRAMDLRYAQAPLICGHYVDDPIAGAESQVDRYLVHGRLRHRERLGVYAGGLGTTAVVLDEHRSAEGRQGAGRGAIIVGLGEWGQLSAGDVAETVRAGILRYLLLVVDRVGTEAATDSTVGREVAVNSVLIGYNSTVNIGVEDSVAAVVRGVCEANRQFEDTVGPVLRVGRLEFVELFLDTAITAAHAVRRLGKRLERDLARLEMAVDPDPTLLQGAGYRHRLSVGSGFGYWPRMMVTDPDRPRSASSADERTASPARRMKFVFLSERARAEAVITQRQPGLAESLIRQAIRSDHYQAELSRTLFHLLVPLEFKEAARDAEQMLLVLDATTANLPWEMLCVDDDPLVIRTAVVRQLEATRFRKAVRMTRRKTACVIADPLTRGFGDHFVTTSGQGLPQLPGAAEEGDRVREILAAGGYAVAFAPSESDALDVFNRLYQAPHRILVIAAHGVFEARTHEGDTRTGVVLSDGMLLTAAEVRQMEIVPEVVFLNSCHLGRMDSVPAYNRLAYSLSRELIEMGVRCVVAAGWAVNDRAATTFASTFFEALVARGASFGRAVHEARRATHDAHPTVNTWGAYQAYGDPEFCLEHDDRVAGPGREPFVAPQELIENLAWIRNEVTFGGSAAPETAGGLIRTALSRSPPGWEHLPAVQAALGAIHADCGPEGFEAARAAYLLAIAAHDASATVPVAAIEQLANLEARQGGEKRDPALIHSAIRRLLHLTTAAGADPIENHPPEAVNSERCALIGSAYKRLAVVLEPWSREADDPTYPVGVREALTISADWYRKAEGDPRRDAFSPYYAQNRLALQAVLGTATPEDAELARRSGQIAYRRYETSLSFWELIMAGDGELIAGMIDGRLMQAATQAGESDGVREVVDSYQRLMQRLPANRREVHSVVTQIRLLKRFTDKRARADTVHADALTRLAGSLGRIADALDPPAADRSRAAPARAAAGQPAGPAEAKRAPKRRPKKAAGKAETQAKGSRKKKPATT